MSFRIFQHILFWLGFILLYVILRMLFPASSDMVYDFGTRSIRYFFSELAFLPWKIIPFYFLFYYLIPRYFRQGHYFKISIYFILTIIVCLFGYRSMITPVSQMMYGEVPDFNVYSLKRFIYSLSDILPAVALASTVKLLKYQIVATKKQESLEKEKLESELNFLKAQTNPHFLFNTLNNLYGLARKNDHNTAPTILKLSNIMRYILHECSAKRIPVEKEIKIIEDYIELEKLRYDDRLTVKFEKKVDDLNQEIAPLIILPFVENAFKHGASESRFETVIDINLQVSKKILKLKLLNTNDPDTVPNADGIGLRNVKRQLDLIYGKNHKLTLYPEKDIFMIELEIEL